MAAVPLTCGVAMLVPVMLMYVPPTPKPSTCSHLTFGDGVIDAQQLCSDFATASWHTPRRYAAAGSLHSGAGFAAID
jgi:hypothetical protein